MHSWEGISEFVAVAEQGSFTAAARQLNISTAQVSRQVSALEERLSTQLLYRTTRKVSVTDIGQIYYEHCRQILDDLTAAERAITHLHNTPKGLVRMTAPVTFGEQSVAPLINDFMVQYPELEVHLYLSNQRMDLVSEGYDLAIRLGKLNDSTMMAKRLGSRTQYLCASPEYLSKYGTPHSLSELGQHKCS